ncbi:tyrosine-type recombinase/integrase [Chloroflexota bacterium]
MRDFKLLAERTGPPIIRFHDLCHTAASLMLNHGVQVTVVSRMLGHAKPSITLDVYGHLLPSMQIEAAGKIDVLITPVAVQQVAPGCTRKRLFHETSIDCALMYILP